jgi:ketosteroid isomerase-like protein
VSAAENKQLVEGFLNAFTRGDLDAVEEALAPDFVNHDAPEFPVAPTGREVRVDFVHVFRVADGRIVERWGVSDSATLLKQLGADRQ